MSRRVSLLGMALALVALSLAITDWAVEQQPGITKANTRRIRLGMTLEQVEGLLGPYLPDGVDTPAERQAAHNRLVAAFAKMRAAGGLDHWAGFSWEGERGTAVVSFDGNGQVVQVFWRNTTSRGGILSRLRDWLGW